MSVLRSFRPLLTLAVFCLGVAACHGEPVHEDAGAQATAEQAEIEFPAYVAEAATIARAIADAPSDAEAILAEHGWTQDQWTDRMVEISSTPELTFAFEEARRR